MDRCWKVFSTAIGDCPLKVEPVRANCQMVPHSIHRKIAVAATIAAMAIAPAFYLTTLSMGYLWENTNVRQAPIEEISICL